jgi:hypothetical protein
MSLSTPDAGIIQDVGQYLFHRPYQHTLARYVQMLVPEALPAVRVVGAVLLVPGVVVAKTAKVGLEAEMLVTAMLVVAHS